MQTNFTTYAARIASLLILSASLAACGGGGSEATTGQATSAETTTTPSTDTSPPAMSPPVVAANNAPTITGSAITTVTAGQAYSFVPHATDADGDSLTFSISSKPSWATFDTTTGRLTGSPTNANVGSYEEIQISVTDGKATTQMAQFSITVAAGAATTVSHTLSWMPPTLNADGSALTDLNGYRILYGTQSGVYTQSVTLNGTGLTTYTIDGMQAGTQYFFAMVAVNSAGTESDKSQEVVVGAT